MNDLIEPSVWTKMYEPSKERLIKNAERMMQNAQDPWFKSYWEKVYQHLLKVYGRLNWCQKMMY